jgi:hypothetical protein
MEYDKVIKEKSGKCLTQSEITALKELADDYEINRDNCKELSELFDGYQIVQTVSRFRENGDEEELRGLLELKNVEFVEHLEKAREDETD